MSALIGTPPNSHDDYLIARGYLLRAACIDPSLYKLDPAKGATLPPKRPSPDQYIPESRTIPTLVGGVVCTVLILAVTGCRLYVRSGNAKLRFGKDDWMIIPAVMVAVTWPILQITLAAAGGAGKHIYDVTYKEAYIFFYVGAMSVWVFYVAVALVKISILLFYMRLSGFCSTRWNIAHQALIACMAAFAICVFFTSIFACKPAYAGWNVRAIGANLGQDNPPRCMNLADRVLAYSLVHVVSDFALLVVPVMMLKDVQMKKSIKFRVWIVGIIGCVSCICSVFRTVVQYRVARMDATWNHWTLFVWSITDLTTGCCAASLPVLSVFINPMIDKWRKLTGRPVKPKRRRNTARERRMKAQNYRFFRHMQRNNGTLGLDGDYGVTGSMETDEWTQSQNQSQGESRSQPTTRHTLENECMKSKDRDRWKSGQGQTQRDLEEGD